MNEEKMRKKIAILLVLVLAFGLFMTEVNPKNRVYAKSAQMYLEIPDSVKKENEITIRAVLDSGVDLYSIDAYLSYDAEMLEFIPDNEFVTGADGVLELKDVYGEETKKAVYEITFKALETGTAQIGFTDVYLIDYEDLEYITVAPSSNSFEIGINKKVEADARLSELIVAPGELTEEFNPNCLEYEMHVDLDVERIGISAIPMDEDSVIELEMPETLQVGENHVVIRVTALSGNVNEYSIKVIRQDWPEDDMEESDNETGEDDAVQESTGEELTEQQKSEEGTEIENEADYPQEKETGDLPMDSPSTEVTEPEAQPVEEIQ
ncbi:MAG: cadherin-like beta sandwich domain-containing protein [Lachnospiraceae bacterium]|nr:cadherin-like beta sandwich domain-containing protein [Lachnospiraceae bacterium]